MKISDLGQFALMDIIAKMIDDARNSQADSWRNLLTGIGDDCAVWSRINTNQIAKVDCQVEGTHFNFNIISWEDLGWKSLAVNLSDIAATGGVPLYALVSLGLPPDTEAENVVSLYKGMLKLANLTGTAIVGGNMSGSPVVFIDISIIGRTGNYKGAYLSRTSSKPGDRIAVTGWLGTAAAGLEMLSLKLKFNPDTTNCLRQAFAQPQPRLEEGRLLVANGVRTGIDISDGLLSDLNHICRASAVGAMVESERLPIRAEVKSAFGEKSYEMALSGGEDYQLLFTAQPDIIEKVIQTSSYPVTEIGEIVAENAGQIILIDKEGKHVQPKTTGWEHFRSR